MGGEDRMDQNISQYQIAMQRKKWYSSLVTYFINVAINNAWQLHKICNGSSSLDLLCFHQYIMRRYLIKYEKLPQPGKWGRPQKSLNDVQYDRISHWVTTQKQTHCAHCMQKWQDVKNLTFDFMSSVLKIITHNETFFHFVYIQCNAIVICTAAQQMFLWNEMSKLYHKYVWRPIYRMPHI